MKRLENCYNTIMKIAKFFKTLKFKIDKYDSKYKTNPFLIPQEITLVWIEDVKDSKEK